MGNDFRDADRREGAPAGLPARHPACPGRRGQGEGFVMSSRAQQAYDDMAKLGEFPSRQARDNEIVRRWMNKETKTSIAKHFGLTRERVHQIIKKLSKSRIEAWPAIKARNESIYTQCLKGETFAEVGKFFGLAPVTISRIFYIAHWKR